MGQTPVPWEQTAGKGMWISSLAQVLLSSLPLQIEFVTGTKKGTTTNATATTTTTASTAVAGRGWLVCSRHATDGVRPSLPCLGERRPWVLGVSSTSSCSFLSPEFPGQLWTQGGGRRAPASLAGLWLLGKGLLRFGPSGPDFSLP